jgi:hypothetical protein
MTRLPDPLIIDLGLVGGSEEIGGGEQVPIRQRRGFVVAAAVLACLLAVAGSERGRPGLGDPLWTGVVSLNGFGLGPVSLYSAEPDGKRVLSRDLRTGVRRWSLDIIGLPEGTTDLGGGVAAVLARPLSESANDRPPMYTVTFVRESTGAQVAQTIGTVWGPSADGLPSVVFTDRELGTEGCTAPEPSCMDVTGWNLATAAAVWRLRLAAGTMAVPSWRDGRMDALAEVADDGTVRLHELSSGAVIGTTVLPTADRQSGQVVLMHDALLTARREPDGIVMTAYRRPSLDRTWSVKVPASAQNTGSRAGWFYVGDCGSVLCLNVDSATQFVDVSTGSLTPPVKAEVVSRLGDGVFLGVASDNANPRAVGAFVIDPAGRIIADFPQGSLVYWDGGHGRAVLMQEGRDRTGFFILDDQGHQRSIGSVPGIDLTCLARGEILACSDPASKLRVWRLPM